MRIAISALAAVLLLPAAHAGNFNKCEINGKTTFTDRPCHTLLLDDTQSADVKNEGRALNALRIVMDNELVGQHRGRSALLSGEPR